MKGRDPGVGAGDRAGFPPQKCGGLIEGLYIYPHTSRRVFSFPPQKCGGLIEGGIFYAYVAQ